MMVTGDDWNRVVGTLTGTSIPVERFVESPLGAAEDTDDGTSL